MKVTWSPSVVEEISAELDASLAKEAAQVAGAGVEELGPAASVLHDEVLALIDAPVPVEC